MTNTIVETIYALLPLTWRKIVSLVIGLALCDVLNALALFDVLVPTIYIKVIIIVTIYGIGVFWDIKSFPRNGAGSNIKKISYSKLLIFSLSVGLLTSLWFLGKAYWEIYGFTGWRNELWARSGYIGSMQADKDFKDGKLILLKIDGENDNLRFSGQKEGPFEIWIVQYIPTLGKPHKYYLEQYVDFYNRRMKNMHDHPVKFQIIKEGSNQDNPPVSQKDGG